MTYRVFSGTALSSNGSSVVSTIGDIQNSTVSGKEAALAMTAGSFSGTVSSTDDNAGIITLLGASGLLHSGKGALVIADGNVNLQVDADEDLFVWARGDVLGSFSAGRDAAVVSHGTFNASVSADNDLAFAYGRNGIFGNLTAGRWIGNGDSAAASADASTIDDVFSHGDIQAQLLAGTAASTDSDKGKIGSVGAVGSVSGNVVANEIGSLRASGLVTASLTANNTPAVFENVSNLIATVPEPELDPSIRADVLAEAVEARTQLDTERQVTADAIVQAKTSQEEDKAGFLDSVAESLSAALSEIDSVMALADFLVGQQKSAATEGLSLRRHETEKILRELESQYRQEAERLSATLISSRRAAAYGWLSAKATKGLVTAQLAIADASMKSQQESVVREAEEEAILFRGLYDARAQRFAKQFSVSFINLEDIREQSKAFRNGLKVGLLANGNALLNSGYQFITLGSVP